MVNEDITRESYEVGEYEHGYFRSLSWGAIFSGLFVALTIFFTLQLLGAGIGISVLDIGNTSNNPEASTFGIGAAIWWFLSGIISLAIGGWISGYFARTPVKMASALHGLIVWSMMYLIMFSLLTTALAGVLGSTLGIYSKSLSSYGQQQTSGSGVQYQGNSQKISPAQQRIVLTAADDQTQQNNQSQQTPNEQEARQIADTTAKITGPSLIGLAIAMLVGAVAAIIGAIAGKPKYHVQLRDEAAPRTVSS